MNPPLLSKNNLFKFIIFAFSLLSLILVIGIFITLFVESIPSFKNMGWKFFISTDWDTNTNQYGAIPFLLGTLYTSFLALLISFPFSLALSVTLGEIFISQKIAVIFSSLIEVISGLPSVVIGFWGIIVLTPVVRELQIFFEMTPYGTSILTAVIVLAFMIIPFSASLGREIINLVPNDLKEAAYGLGATRSEVIFKIILPYATPGILAGFLLSLGRVLGETIAVTILIGNAVNFSFNVLENSNTIASVIATELAEAIDERYFSALIELALILMLITFLVNVLGRWYIKKISNRFR